MKIKIWEKDDFFQSNGGPRMDMDPGVVQLPEKPVRLVWSYWFDVPPYGQVHNLRLEDGEIVGEATFFNPTTEESIVDLLEHKDVRFGGYYLGVEREVITKGKQEVVTKCELKAVSIVMVSSMPGYS